MSRLEMENQIAELSGSNLEADGDLLLYDKSGKVSGVVSNTEKALRAVLKSSNFELTDEDIRKDLLREKDNDFVQTLTYSALRSTYGQITGMRPAFAMVPKIALSLAALCAIGVSARPGAIRLMRMSWAA